jgi:Lipase (class 3)
MRAARWRAHVARATLGAAVLMLLSGCGTAVTWYASMDHNNGKNDVRDPKSLNLAADEYLVDTAMRFGLMALLSEAVYRRDLSREERDARGCAYVAEAKPGNDGPRYGLPDTVKGSDNGKDNAKGKPRWLRWAPQPAPTGFKPCMEHESGLHYETYVYQDENGALLEAVIAFRGTENRDGQGLKDWFANFAPVLGFESSQYAAARPEMRPLVDALKQVLVPQGGKARIYATGHSLGGGLAQQAGYMIPEVLEVYTFNTSPVTNWSWLRLAEEVKNAYPVMHRVYHGGEFLEKVRFISTSFTGARYNRHDIGVQLEDRSNGKGHSIQILACGFARLIASRGENAAPRHNYPVDYIERVLKKEDDPDQACSKAKAGA